MKKIFTLISAAVLAGSAWAASFTPSLKADKTYEIKTVVAKQSVSATDSKASYSFDLSKANLLDLSTEFRGRKAPAKAEAEAQSIEGDYTIGIGDYYIQGGAGSIEQDATIEIYESEYVILDSEYFMTMVMAQYASDTQTVTFLPLKLGQGKLNDGTIVYIALFPFAYDDENGAVPGSYSITFDPATGAFDIPTDHGLGWFAYSDENYSEALGWMDIFDLESLEKVVEDPTTWTNVGNATFEDGWVLPAFGIAADEAPYEVPLEQNDENKNLFRLVDPYHGNWPLASEGFNETDKVGYIQFDLSDPDHVVFSAVEAGFANTELDLRKLYCLNTLGFFVGYTGRPAAEVIAQLGDEIPYTTYKDGVVTLTSVVAEEGGYENDACFGIQGNKFGGYTWTDNKTELPVNMSAKITFPTDFNFVPEQSGIGSVIADEDANAPVEFFNLQGVKVENPENGLYIRRQGKNVSKVIIRN